MSWPRLRRRETSFCLGTRSNWSSLRRVPIPKVPIFRHLNILLAGAKTMPADKGLFLEKTWRLHPKLCEFTSEVFYEGRLHSREGLENQKIDGHPWLGQSGLWFLPDQHDGNQNASPEEVEHIAGLVESL